MTEGKFMSYTLAAVIFLILIHIFQSQILTFYDPINYLGFHTILEFFSISISISIFLYGWKMFESTKGRNYLLLSITFFLVGMTDLLHTVTFKGMPYFFTESSIPKSTWFWLIARMIQSVLILFFLLLPNRKLQKDLRPVIIIFSISCILIMTFIIFQNENSLPLLFIEGKGTTFFKNCIEYFVSFLHLVALVLTLYRYSTNKIVNHLYSALAFTFLFLSELVFTIYQSVYDLDNFTGHILKAIGYYFIMKAFLYNSFMDEKKMKETNFGDKKNFTF